MVLSRVALVLALVGVAAAARAERPITRDALSRLDEILELRREDGLLDARDLVPVILVCARPRYEASQGWFEAQAARSLIKAFGAESVRVCEACMQPRAEALGGRLEYASGPASLEEIVRLDDRYRGQSARAKVAVWIDETQSGVAIRMTDLRTAQLRFAQNVDPLLREYEGTERSFRLSQELERRARGDTLTHALVDLGLFPGQHFDMEWDDQWGETNANLTGVVLSFWDPLFGIGVGYHRAIAWRHVLVGAQVILSVPTVIAQAQTDSDIEIIDPFLTGVGVVRFPFGNSNYAGLLTVSTNGEVAVGISLLNTSLIPVLP